MQTREGGDEDTEIFLKNLFQQTIFLCRIQYFVQLYEYVYMREYSRKLLFIYFKIEYFILTPFNFFSKISKLCLQRVFLGK